MNKVKNTALNLERRVARKVSLNWLDRVMFYQATGRRLNLRQPQYLNDKLMWLNRYDTNPMKALCADKYRVREYLHTKGLDDLAVPLLGHWERAEDIPYEALPEQFVLKCNHGCDFNIIVTDKSQLDIPLANAKLNTWLSTRYGGGCERHYLQIKPCILAEKYLPEVDGGGVADYRWFCFNGEPIFCATYQECNPQAQAHNWKGKPVHDWKKNVYSASWQRLEALKEGIVAPDDLPAPANLAKQLSLCRVLAADFPFVRVDFYDINSRLYLSELTFTPNQNILSYFTDEFLLEIGKQLVLP